MLVPGLPWFSATTGHRAAPSRLTARWCWQATTREGFTSSLWMIGDGLLRSDDTMDSLASRPSSGSTSWAHGALFTIIGLFVVLWGLDAVVFWQNDPPWPFAALSAGDGGFVLTVLVVLFFVNAVLLDSLMADKVSDPRAVPGWLRRLRFVLAGVPLIGMYTVAFWLWLIENHPRRVLPRPPAELAGERTDVAAWSWLPQRYGVLFASRAQWLWNARGFFVGLLIVDTLGLLVVTLWWASFGPDLLGLPAGYLATVPLHVAAFACVVSYLLTRRRLFIFKPIRRILVWPLAALWCLPAPICLLGGFVIVLTESAAEQRLLARAAYRGRRQWTRSGMKVYSDLRRSTQRGFGGPTPAQPACVRDCLALLYRLKIALLPIETVAATAVLIWWSDRLQTLGFVVRLGAWLLAAAATLLAITGGAAVLARRIFSRRSNEPPYLAYVTAAQAMVASGLCFGILLGSGNFGALGGRLQDFAILGCLVVVVIVALRRGRIDVELWAWTGVLVAVALSGSWISKGGPPAALAISLLALGAVALPLATVGSGVFLGPWLLRPMTLAHLGDRRLSGSSRLGLLAVATSMILPFGGLLIPFWLSARRRWISRFDRELGPRSEPTRTVEEASSPASGEAQRRPETGTPARARSVRRDHAFAHLVSHLANSNKNRRLWTLLEEKHFLADQARHARGFDQSSSDLESAVLPAAIGRRDWNRFLRFALVAVNLHELADHLSDEGLLEILARDGHSDQALDAAGRIADLPRRLGAQAMVGLHLERHEANFAICMNRLCDDLEHLVLPPDQDARDRLRELLIDLARVFSELGPAIRGHVARRWPAERAQRLDDEVRTAAAWGRAGEKLGPELWDELSHVRSSEVLKLSLPEMIAASAPYEDPEAILEQVRALPAAGPELPWLCRAAMLGALAERRPAAAWTLWQVWWAEEPAPWSQDLVVQGVSFFQCLTHEQLTPVAKDVDDEEARVALWILVLFGIQRSQSRGGPPEGWQRHQVEDLAASTRTAIEHLPPAGRLTWLLDWVDAVTPESLEVPASSPPPALPLAVPRAELKRLAAFLKLAAYAVPPDQIVRFFDLVAVLSPRGLGFWLADAVIASPAGPDLLRYLARNSRHETVLETLFEQSNRYLLGFSLSTEETAKLWNVLLTRLASRLCVLSARRGERSGAGHLAYLKKALALVRDQDALRIAVADALADAGETTLAAEVCAGILGDRSRHTALMRLWPVADDPAEPSLAPDALYERLASADDMRDELRALAALRNPEPGVDAVFGRRLEPMVNRERTVPALIRLMLHRSPQAATDTAFGRREQRVAWHVLEQALAVSLPARTLVALTPELPALSRPLGVRHAVEEVHESFRQLLTLSAVPWSDRRQALEALLARIGTVFGAPSGQGLGFRRERWLAALLRALARELFVARGGEYEIEDLLPLLVVTAERLPGVARRLGHSRARWRRHWLPRPPAGGLSLEAESRDQVLALCNADDDQRMAFAASLRESPEPRARTAHALVYLVSNRHADAIPGLIETLPSALERDDLCLRLIRHRWVRGTVAERVMALIRNPRRDPAGLDDATDQLRRDLYLEARLWHRLETAGGHAGESWIHDLASLATQEDLDPDDLRYEPWFRALRARDDEQGLAVLADAVVGAFRGGSAARAKRILRLWLHAHPGHAADQQTVLSSMVEEAVRL